MELAAAVALHAVQTAEYTQPHVSFCGSSYGECVILEGQAVS